MAARVLLAMALARSAAVSGADEATAVAWFYKDPQCHDIAKETDREVYTLNKCHAVDGGGSEKGKQCGNGKYIYKYYSDPSDCADDTNGELRHLDLGECRGPDSRRHFVTVACGPPAGESPPAPGPPANENLKAIVTFYQDAECEHHSLNNEYESYQLNKCHGVDNGGSEMGLSCSDGEYKYMYYSHSKTCPASDGNGTIRTIALGTCKGPDSNGNYLKVQCDSRVPKELYQDHGGAVVPGLGLPVGGALALLAVVGALAVRAARWRRAPPAADEESLVA